MLNVSAMATLTLVIEINEEKTESFAEDMMVCYDSMRDVVVQLGRWIFTLLLVPLRDAKKNHTWNISFLFGNQDGYKMLAPDHGRAVGWLMQSLLEVTLPRRKLGT